MAAFTRKSVPAHQLSGHVKAKWPVGTLSEGFVPLPKKLLRSLGALFSGEGAMEELAAVLAVVDFRRPPPTRNPSPEYLAFLAGLSVDELKAALNRLQQKGYLSIRPDSGGSLEVGLDGLCAAIEELTSEESGPRRTQHAR